METSNETPQEEKQPQNTPNENKGGNKLFIVLAGIFFLAFLGVGGLYLKEMSASGELTNQNTTLTSEKESLTKELEDITFKLEEIRTSNKELAEELIGKDSLIKVHQAQIAEMISKGEYKKAKDAMYKYKKMAQEYETEIAALKEQVDSLNVENKLIKAEVETAMIKNVELEESNSRLSEKVAIGSVLKANDLFASGIQLKGSKEKETTKSKKVDKIRTCFTLSENKIAEKGEKDVFLRIVAPDGKILTQGNDSKFEFNGEEVLYSVKKEIYYDNNASDICVYASKGVDFISGAYTVEVFADGFKIGDTVLELK